ncbi:NAD-dependent epimerase/dehydratase family protein [Halorubrum sp. DTA46]|uniref:NAD-dependent epimerase/dehydratase family protein n=1 Tax=Halorubrum sp. DTA46 TaxID=3402162 RepID=UPI003AAB8AE0
MRVLIVGGTGLISTAITRQLVEAGHEVVAFTRGTTDADVPEAVQFRHGDRTRREDLDRVAAEVDPDCVIDMVCFDPETARAAVDVFAGIADQYVFCSTVDVYRRPPADQPITESALRESETGAAPVSAYAADKSAAEDVFFDAHGDAFATTVIRPWSTYGDRGPVLHTLGSGTYYLDRVREGKPLIVHGDGTALWGPCHRDDVAGAFVGAVGNGSTHGESYHVTGGEPMTWNQYHRRVASALDAPEPELVHIPTDLLRERLPERTDLLADHLRYTTVFDTAKAERDLGFAYEIDFETGVRRAAAALESTDDIDPWDAEDDDEVVREWRAATAAFVGER